jgi:hypothetical protein
VTDPVRQPRVSRRTLLGGAGLAGAGAASPLLWVPPAASATRPVGVHLTYGADARKAMAVSWSTPGSVRRPRLEIGRNRGYGTTVFAESESSRRVGTVYHHVDLADLKPGKRYYYRLSHRGANPVTGSFVTAPSRPERYTFVAFGDMGVSSAAQRHVALMNRMKPRFAFVAGDLCYADLGSRGTSTIDQQDFALWDHWLRQIQPSASRVPWMTTVGNHEMENRNGPLGYDGYLDRFRLPGNGPSGGPVTYSFVHGNVGFIALDGNDASYEIPRNRNYLGTLQDDWLRDTLGAMRLDPTVDFIVVGFHNCMYCTNDNHGSDDGNRSRWEPIFDTYTVDVVINGHNHCYERTHPLRAGTPMLDAPRGARFDSSIGTTYITAGGGGQRVYRGSGGTTSDLVVEGGGTEQESTEWSSVVRNTHSLAFFTAVPPDASGLATLKLKTLRADGRVVDKAKLTRQR